MVAIIRLKGILTKEGEIKVDLPDNWQPGEIEILLPANEMERIDEGLDIALEFQGQTLGEILDSGLVGSGADWEIGDSAEWVAEQRRKRREERLKRWME
ncbi:MAG: hypothetical protein Q9P01_10985 [Anaerolineae bacterium]|nr:hypothetical protein [Anaerolineae bacterium]MDQ7035329.1 hypothetical protein [Anaerolineae bacterium]